MQLKEADATISSLRDEASEREDVIGQNYGTIQLLRQQVGELEKSKFVMGFHAKVTSRPGLLTQTLDLSRYVQCYCPCMLPAGMHSETQVGCQ